MLSAGGKATSTPWMPSHVVVGRCIRIRGLEAPPEEKSGAKLSLADVLALKLD